MCKAANILISDQKSYQIANPPVLGVYFASGPSRCSQLTKPAGASAIRRLDASVVADELRCNSVHRRAGDDVSRSFGRRRC
jgi:hypothetical protein